MIIDVRDYTVKPEARRRFDNVLMMHTSFDPRRYRSLGLPGIAERRLLPTATSRMR